MSKRFSVNSKSKKGFTLVELIVVLVILAILAAILIPTMLGFIDRARKRKELLRAKDCLTMIQADLVDRYGKYGNTLEPGRKAENTIIGQDNIKNGPFESNGDVNATERPWAKKIIDDLDIEGINNGQEPYVIVVGVGSNYDKGSQASLLAQTTEHDKYTVFYMFYMETPESTPLFYFNGEWSEHHPRANDSSDLMDTNNVIQIGPLAGKRLQYYCLSNKTGKGTIQDKQFWNWIRGL